MCNCNKEMLEMINGRIQDGLIENKEKFTDYNGKWSHGVLRLDGTKGGDVMMNVDYSYQGFKTNGDEKKNKTKGSIFMAMKFCPFCGVKYNEE